MNLSSSQFVLQHVHLRTRSMARMEGFYKGVLGMKPAAPGGPGAVALGFAPDRPMVVLTEDRQAPAYSRHNCGLHHIAFQYPSRLDLSRALNRIARCKQPITGATHHGIAESIYLADPDGNGLEIFALAERTGAGRRADRSLDLADLLEAGRAEAPPLDPPPGVTLDHIHFQVRELAAAELFFHGHLGFNIRTRVPGAIFLTTSEVHHQIAVNVWSDYAAVPPGGVGLAAYRLGTPDPATFARVGQYVKELGCQVADAPATAARQALAFLDPGKVTLELEMI